MAKYLGVLCLVLAGKLPGALLQDTLLASRQFCGYQHSDDYHRNDASISLDEFPWSAQLVYNHSNAVDCSGSLVSRRYVLTSANCLSTPFSILIGVRLGDYNVTSDRDCVQGTFGEECSDPTQYFLVEEQIAHPAYYAGAAEHNVALLRLSNDVTYSEYIRPICLPRSSDRRELSTGRELTTTGWGTLRDGVTKTEIKKKVVATLVPTRRCARFLPNSAVLPSYLCVKEKHTFTCGGDGGAPLMVSERSQWEQVGILVFGGKCGSRTPTAYAKVAFYLDWIVAKLRP
ncbi:phenoloxidase-activating factor 1-like [Photinus pyralis]|uniref:phenoloxidase-activating factor 1-like n=1 Tax=Photinus pyralis TaxID=7054 RepID=UPI001267382D|nr:phenoloxidase-activating factor 1-like [Photinus pyralis]